MADSQPSPRDREDREIRNEADAVLRNFRWGFGVSTKLTIDKPKEMTR